MLINLVKGEMENKKNAKNELHTRIRLLVDTNFDEILPLRKHLSLMLHKRVSDGSGTRERCGYYSWI